MTKVRKALQHEADNYPRSMRDPKVRERRRAMLSLPHIAPLTDYVERLRQRPSIEVPDFDPLDGGIEARILFLFEKPGPMTSDKANKTRSGSGFISRDNDDRTAEATFNFMIQAGIPRALTACWNVIPWGNGTRKVTVRELREGIESTKELTTLLPRSRAVVLVGEKAAKAKAYLGTTGLALFTSAHPSPLVKASWIDRWKAIPLAWAKAAQFIESTSEPAGN